VTATAGIGPNPVGRHGVCVQLINAFLAFTKHRNNDLSSPIPSAGFPELKPGDRWEAAEEKGCGPPAILAASFKAKDQRE
jgi:hypothetical protein